MFQTKQDNVVRIRVCGLWFWNIFVKRQTIHYYTLHKHIVKSQTIHNYTLNKHIVKSQTIHYYTLQIYVDSAEALFLVVRSRSCSCLQGGHAPEHVVWRSYHTGLERVSRYAHEVPQVTVESGREYNAPGSSVSHDSRMGVWTVCKPESKQRCKNWMYDNNAHTCIFFIIFIFKMPILKHMVREISSLSDRSTTVSLFIWGNRCANQNNGFGHGPRGMF
jgi:hypothetical protein